MGNQYKLYIIDKKHIETTLIKLYEEFPDDEIIRVTANTIAIKYDYNTKDYKYVLEKMSDFKATQNIITASKFFTILNKCIEMNIFIDEIKLFQPLQEENDRIEKYLVKINYSKEDRGKYKDLLFSELEWFNYDEGIDIKNMTFRIPSKTKPISIKFSVFDNGVILIDDLEVIDAVIEIIKAI